MAAQTGPMRWYTEPKNNRLKQKESPSTEKNTKGQAKWCKIWNDNYRFSHWGSYQVSLWCLQYRPVPRWGWLRIKPHQTTNMSTALNQQEKTNSVCLMSPKYSTLASLHQMCCAKHEDTGMHRLRWEDDNMIMAKGLEEIKPHRVCVLTVALNRWKCFVCCSSAALGHIHTTVSPVALSRSKRKDLLSLSSTHTTFWVMFSEVEPTLPTARKMYSSRKSRARICMRSRKWAYEYIFNTSGASNH